jgi:hypothetical protein
MEVNMNRTKLGMFLVVVVAFATWGCEKPAAKEEAPAAKQVQPAETKAPGTEMPTYPTRVFFGDTHLHTIFSFDAGTFGVRLGPDDAYRFAKGEELMSSTGVKAKLAKPLDFLVVADHSENLGFFPKLMIGAVKIVSHPLGKKWHEAVKEGGMAAGEAAIEMIKLFSKGQFPMEIATVGEEMRAPWNEMIDTAEKHNQPGKFTAFIGYEWTSMPGAKNLHRVLIFKDGKEKATQVLPFSSFDSDDPEKLWDWMDGYEKATDGRVLAIAHNGNLSNGQMFILETQEGKAFDKAYGLRRVQKEPLYEVTQIKGDGEAHPYLSPTDEFADFENWDVGNLDLSASKKKEMLQYEYGREALKNGLKVEAGTGANPFKFGMIGSTDSHTALASADDDNFFGKASTAEPSAVRAAHEFISGKGGKIMGWQMTASGYAAVWAKENTREALFAAMERKEVYATTGPRMTVRFFGGWDYVDADAKGDVAAVGYAKGVPMGGDLTAPPSADASPTFLIAALKEADGANLDRVQVIKGWVDGDGNTQEKVFNVALSDDREVGADGKAPPVGNTVNVKEASYENSIGAGELMVTWKDPEFDQSQRAFYYVRALEIPTPRWTAYDAKRFGAKMPKDVPMSLQQRAYTSPIWFTPAN